MLTGIMTFSLPVLAQQDADEDSLEEIIVTGSRLKSETGYEAPTPVSVLTAGDMEARGSTNVADLINEMPSFTGSMTPTSTTLNSRQNGRNGLDIRGLGNNRNLVLVNGRRFVPFDENGIVDVNAIPSVAIKRVEMVTGGASAAYGSDAISGVVNIIFDDELEGGKVEAQYGEAFEGDNENYRVSAAFGHHFADGRGHFMIAAEVFDNKGVPETRSRDWGREHWGLVNNSADTGPNDGIPAWHFRPDVALFIGSPNGVTLPGFGFVSDNIEFFPDGTYGPRDLGIVSGNSLMEGGSGSFLVDRTALSIPNERKAIFGTLSYQMTDNARFFAEASYTKAESIGRFVDAFSFGVFVNSGNPFIPPDLQAAMDEAGDPGLVLFRTFEEFPPAGSRSENTNKRIVAGFDGNFGANDGWWYEGYAQFGENQFDQTFEHNWLQGNINQAALVVNDPITGQPVCAANAGGANGAPGCVPMNLFGKGSPSQASIDYATLPFGFSKTKIKQTVVAFTLGADLFEGWAGPVSAAFGADYRDESLDRDVDEASQNNQWRIINAHRLSGSYDVTSAFAEFNVPLVSGDQQLDFNAAGRYADYSTVGGTFSWKTGLVWEPNDSFRIRASMSQDIRAPSIGETFLEQLLLFGTVSNPFTGTSDFHEIFNTGNENLSEESAITTTLGFVWSPQSVNFQFSVDWYNIDFEDGIGQLTNQQIMDNCFAGTPGFCDLITFRPDQTVVRMINTNLNLGTLEFEGIDISATYSVDAGPGVFGMNFLANHRITQKIAPSGGEPLDVVGEVGGTNTVGAPKWKATFQMTYDLDNWGLFGQLRYTDGGKYDITWGPEDLSNEDNSISSWTYVDLSAYYNFSLGNMEYLQIYAGVGNVFDKDPAIAPINFISTVATNTALYDTIGRQWYAGVRMKF
jgi:outer membrane receptor protein involved in Fe transport